MRGSYLVPRSRKGASGLVLFSRALWRGCLERPWFRRSRRMRRSNPTGPVHHGARPRSFLANHAPLALRCRPRTRLTGRCKTIVALHLRCFYSRSLSCREPPISLFRRGLNCPPVRVAKASSSRDPALPPLPFGGEWTLGRNGAVCHAVSLHGGVCRRRKYFHKLRPAVTYVCH